MNVRGLLEELRSLTEKDEDARVLLRTVQSDVSDVLAWRRLLKAAHRSEQAVVLKTKTISQGVVEFEVVLASEMGGFPKLSVLDIPHTANYLGGIQLWGETFEKLRSSMKVSLVPSMGHEGWYRDE